MRILVTGGAGYIGSFMTKALISRGDDVTVFDNLERGHKDAVDSKANFIQGDLRNLDNLNNLFRQNTFDAAIHFAGLIAVSESEEHPDLYYQNNVVGSNNFFETAIKIGKVKNFIFSSSAAIYGDPTKIPIPENHPKNPTSAYGKNKLEIERSLALLKEKYPEISYAALRYFNASGAALDGSMGEAHLPETHLISNIIKSVLNSSTFELYGTDYKTEDGTCIRDYIHVLDLVESHILALSKIYKNPGEYYYNVGTGKGYSNSNVIETVEKVSGKKVDVHNAQRRAGDPGILIADPLKIKTELGFKPKFSDLETIVESAWKYHLRNG